MLANYITSLNFIDGKLKKFFERQKPYIFCRKGCARCCKNAQFPYSSIETAYLLFGFMKLDKSVQEKVDTNVQRIIEEKKNLTLEFRGSENQRVIDVQESLKQGKIVLYKIKQMTNERA